MFRFNLHQAFDIDWDFDPALLATKNPVLVDGRMQPHEWIRSKDGTIIKVDGCTHGDDHFFPGPTDIAWDLAGAIVEWSLDRKSTRLNSSHVKISYAAFCLKKQKRRNESF